MFETVLLVKTESAAKTTTATTTKGTTTTTPETCKPGKPVVFLKTHKTASTTLTNIFLRYAEKNKLLVGLPPERHWELAGYPAKFDAALVDPAAKEYQLLAHHFRYGFYIIFF